MTRRSRTASDKQPTSVDPRVLRLFYAARDLQFALSAFDFLLELDEEGLYSKVELRRFRCFLDAGVIAYCRPFTATKGVPTLSLKQIGVNATREESELHGRLMDYRNKVVAHSDADRMRIVVTTLKPFDDQDVFMPMMIVDEGVPFLDDRNALIDWLRRLMHSVGSKTFEIVQAAPQPFAFTQDYVANPSAERG